MKSRKTVYILGAGFSAPAGGADQAALLRRIFQSPNTDPKFQECRDALRYFLLDAFNVSAGGAESLSLEDVFTPIDRCLADGVALRNKDPQALWEIRQKLEYLISVVLDDGFRDAASGSQKYVRDFAQHLVALASHRAAKAAHTDSADAAKAYDPFSIISLNWDVVLDRCLHEELEARDGGVTSDYAPIGVVDYCCYISSLAGDDKRVRPGLWALGARGYNVKLLKIHGSMNWLQCSNCQRLFVAFDGGKLNVLASTHFCRHCSIHNVEARLQGSLVMPTFLKDLSNFQIKLVWQNASVELLEAREIVFIGYSLPQADFEFRQLLSRMVHKDSTIHVVLFQAGRAQQYEEECSRYKQFFGNRSITFEPDGVKVFVEKLRSSATSTPK